MSTATATEAPQRTPTPKGERPDVFFSYSRKDADFVHGLIADLEARGKDVWVDADDIRATAEWRREIASGIDASDSFAFVITPDSLRSDECVRELDHAVQQGKRIVPLLRRESNGLVIPPELESRNWIFCRDADDADAYVATLVDALETDLEWVRAHTRLLVRAREWEQRTGEKSLLLRGADLREAEQRLATVAPGVEPQPTPLQREFVLASRRGQSRRQRITLGAVAVGLVVTAVLAVLAIFQRNAAVDNERTATSRELATAAAAQLELDPELSVLLASEAVERKPTREAEDILRRALAATNVIATTEPHGAWANGVSFSRDGKRILTSSRDSTARLSDAATGRTLAVLRGHRNWLGSARFSPTGERIVTASLDRTARIWSGDGRAVLTLRGHGGPLSRAEWSPDGRFVVTCGADRTARIWDAGTGRQLRVLRGHRKWVTRAVFSPDGRLVATASEDGTARLWDAATGRAVRVVRSGGSFVLAVAFSPDSRLWASGSVGTVVLSPARRGGADARLRGHVDQVLALAFSPDGRTLASGSADTSVRLWDVGDRSERRVLRGHVDGVTGVAFDPTGTLLATSAGDGSARLWDRGGRLVSELRGHRAWITAVAFSRDGRLVATSSADRTARVWDATHGAPRALVGTRGTLVSAAEFAPDGRRLVTAGVPARLWTIPGARAVAAMLPGASVVAHSRDGRVIAAGMSGGEVLVYDARNGRVAADPADHEGEVTDVEVSGDGTLVATAGRDGLVRVARTSNGAAVATLRHRDDATTLAFAPGSDLIATGSDDDTAGLWNPRTGRRVATLRHARDVRTVAFAPDGRLVATSGTDEAVRLWTRDGERVAVLRYHSRPVNRVAFSDDGRLLASASSDGSARVWDVATRRGLADLRHGGLVSDAEFGPNGRFLVTSSWDGSTRVWEAASGRLLVRFWGHPSYVFDVDFDRSARWIASAGFGDAARLYACEVCGSLDDLRAFAERRVRRELTPEERARYLHERGD